MSGRVGLAWRGAGSTVTLSRSSRRQRWLAGGVGDGQALQVLEAVHAHFKLVLAGGYGRNRW